MSQKILLVEDDADTAAFIVGGLAEEGFVVDRARDGREGLFMGTDHTYQCIVLDRMLPGLDGMAVLAALRGAGVHTPVIILSALGATEDRITGLTRGADDYLAKPFAFAELLARIRLLVRRGSGAPTEQTKLSCGDLEMDLLSRRVRRGARAIDLQPREFRLLEFLLRHADQVVTRTMLLEGVWDYHFDPGTNVIDVHISRLRKKIDEGEVVALLHTVRGAGYRIGTGA
ncbi:two component transcriptional regulator, winged helix family [Novosphingobium aromaticivorans DSM 12444]|uniref:Two component transcriptional regulator, winged helix family n=1 Tax=Novosphingobium aromaticivorans (strain ATCC 700278 / DSM 12444 / CCUG 56034 / CIP 105152 / NBRC 16084 / F199) TaxID=279238 RepID=Q2G7Y4_NOVAD|nr:response regulator transcription factor [Novosphingobium aromaticivorans]ABD26039.1 two component transcriptional regulator, winged helix family [Novosphingobium aromaticivorans DSM 12444]SCY60900.1 two component transcriptional regulator, winged helix family [Novosphingobium aromaticivorans]